MIQTIKDNKSNFLLASRAVTLRPVGRGFPLATQ